MGKGKGMNARHWIKDGLLKAQVDDIPVGSEIQVLGLMVKDLTRMHPRYAPNSIEAGQGVARGIFGCDHVTEGVVNVKLHDGSRPMVAVPVTVSEEIGPDDLRLVFGPIH
jgi:hypothetical protein